MKCANIVNVFDFERTADFYFRQFLKENNDIYKVDRVNRAIYTKDGIVHWFMGEFRYSCWCKGTTYLLNGVVFRSGYPLKEVEE